MSLRHISLPRGISGDLWLSEMPGRSEPLSAYLETAAKAGIGHLLCLTGDAEIASKSPDYSALIAAGNLPLLRHVYAIEDFGTPENPGAFAQWIEQSAVLLRAGERMVLHCAAGIGRTGTAAHCLLTALGLDKAVAAHLVEAAGSHPETEAQRAFVEGFVASV
ncbi:MAG: phosphatase [Rubritepida sp.]|nr:phosphatase [Rubritepida sp.]